MHDIDCHVLGDGQQRVRMNPTLRYVPLCGSPEILSPMTASLLSRFFGGAFAVGAAAVAEGVATDIERYTSVRS